MGPRVSTRYLEFRSFVLIVRGALQATATLVGGVLITGAAATAAAASHQPTASQASESGGERRRKKRRRLDTHVESVRWKFTGIEMRRKMARCAPALKRAKVPAIKWKAMKLEYNRTNSTDGARQRAAKLRALYAGYSTSQIFSTILDDEILTHIIIQTDSYAKQKNEHGFSLDLDELKKFIGILMLSGYHSLPRQKLYWCV
ncbi:hypothetical protein HPB51_010170 [Rhipicephalus microplus]|uniref:PiggyBac transposable element-derived protein domain-containing protein n=1 Tax=Rhipicephalus microplus TaxID=6941 RepID=A0A9J6F0V4_RHIMP|nr:hypothetical protein HPB51_010170 [Rhipicephalus microplus]